jgi:hypothetical protein
MQDSLARICQSLESDPAWERVQDQASTGKSCALLASFDPSTSSLKMSQQSFLTDSNVSCPTWSRSGMTVDGLVYALPTVVPRISGIGGGVWLSTPTAQSKARSQRFINGDGNQRMPNPEEFVRMWPTPTASMSKGSSPNSLTRKDNRSRINDRLDHFVMNSDGGKLNPEFVEWLMGWPIGYTASKPSETDKSPSKPQSRGDSSEGQ